MDMDRYIGRLLDNRYEILEVIGSGGMSVVYKARCHRLNRLVAIKILKDENLQDEDFRRRFHAESQAVAMLSHPNIVSVYDVSTDEDADYIVMELIDGITLKQYMQKKGVLNWKETLHFAIQIAKALEHAHSRGLVHRDIKPHNVMVLKNGSVKVADFGIARIMSQSNTLTKEALGSVHYISPEQAKGGRVDNRSDLYSLGVVMYEMITGRPPYDGESPVSVAIQHINGGASRPTTVNPNVPKGLEQIIMKAMERDLRKRYPTATAMLYDMDEFRKDPSRVFVAELPAADPSASTRIVKTEEAEPETAEQEKAAVVPVEPDRRQKRRQEREKAESNRSNIATIAIVICSVVAMIAIIVCLVLALGGNGDQVPQVEVPNLIGCDYSALRVEEGLTVRSVNSRYDSAPAGQIIWQSLEPGTSQNVGTEIHVIVSLGPEPAPIYVPQFTGRTEEQYKAALNALNLDLKITVSYTNTSAPKGTVINVSPTVGSKLKAGEAVTITVSDGPRVILKVMPQLVGGNLELAKQKMTERLFSNVEYVEVDSTMAKGLVVSQSVDAGTELDTTTHIIVEYSSGKRPAEPEPEEITISYTIENLPVKDADITLSLKQEDTVILEEIVITAGTTSAAVELTGSGSQTYAVYIDGEYWKEITVDFDA